MSCPCHRAGDKGTASGEKRAAGWVPAVPSCGFAHAGVLRALGHGAREREWRHMQGAGNFLLVCMHHSHC